MGNKKRWYVFWLNRTFSLFFSYSFAKTCTIPVNGANETKTAFEWWWMVGHFDTKLVNYLDVWWNEEKCGKMFAFTRHQIHSADTYIHKIHPSNRIKEQKPSQTEIQGWPYYVHYYRTILFDSRAIHLSSWLWAPRGWVLREMSNILSSWQHHIRVYFLLQGICSRCLNYLRICCLANRHS